MQNISGVTNRRQKNRAANAQRFKHFGGHTTRCLFLPYQKCGNPEPSRQLGDHAPSKHRKIPGVFWRLGSHLDMGRPCAV